MRRHYLFIAVALMCTVCKAQNAVINYQLIYNKNFERGRDLVHFDSYLSIQNDESWFYSILSESDSIVLNAFETYPPVDSLFSVYKNRNFENLIFMEPDFTGRKQYYQDTLYPMTWKIQEEYKKIGDFECRKATAIFRGRKYIAWYCKDVPISNGPWKFGGLPGLILEVFEENSDMVFSLRSISFKAKPRQIFVPSDINKIPGYEKYKSNWRELFRKMDMNLQASTVQGNCSTCKEQSKSKINLWEKWE